MIYSMWPNIYCEIEEALQHCTATVRSNVMKVYCCFVYCLFVIVVGFIFFSVDCSWLTFSFTPAVTVCPRRSSLPLPCQVTSAVSSPFLPKMTQAWSSDSARWTSFSPNTWQAAITANATPELSSLVPEANLKYSYIYFNHTGIATDQINICTMIVWTDCNFP